MNRRRLLRSGGVCIGGLLSGCLGTRLDRGRGTPTYDCDLARRPTPAVTGGEVDPASYPTRPDSFSDTSAVVAYATQYERAYRRNELLAEHGHELRTMGLSVDETWAHEAPDGTAVVRLRYTYYYEFGAVTPAVADSPTTYASYYVDESVVIRAAGTGYREDESTLDPDPWTEGRPVECEE